MRIISADLNLSEPDDLGRPNHLPNRLLVVFGKWLLEEAHIFEKPANAAFNDLFDRLFRLTIVACDCFER